MKKRMKMKLLDYTLIGLLAGTAPLAAAQTSAPPVQGGGDAAKSVDCQDEGCSSEDGLLFRLRTRSYDKPLTEGTDAQAEVSVRLSEEGRSVTGRGADPDTSSRRSASRGSTQRPCAAPWSGAA